MIVVIESIVADALISVIHAVVEVIGGLATGIIHRPCATIRRLAMNRLTNARATNSRCAFMFNPR